MKKNGNLYQTALFAAAVTAGIMAAPIAGADTPSGPGAPGCSSPPSGGLAVGGGGDEGSTANTGAAGGTGAGVSGSGTPGAGGTACPTGNTGGPGATGPAGPGAINSTNGPPQLPTSGIG